ncbi:phosphonate C-P lyase system protein PhnG [Thermodesulfobacterium sp. TA1]|uniref:phosphonate C-P lyase system protein PhnG n=1 Tax=Thermodesulfobacterium sp. TA1 TaxID=2234087 RepID=UPI001232DB94|nr:phosphonate C-P lyase system protein PhnG [Thermodesulfobacterium sp. TA1]QER41872.1 phosphonate C-P lyase system protein PhnG [Thermodesulfobacterium sp. TA1]
MDLDFREVVVKMDQKSLNIFFKMLSMEEVKVKKGPQAGCLMIKAKDCFGVEFCLGEALVFEAEVEYKGIKGYGLVLAEEEEKAVAIAVLEAVFKSDEENLKKKLHRFLSKEKKKIEEAWEKERKLIAKTKVQFETMVKR